MNNEQLDFNAGIVGLGVYLPEKRMTEQDFINAGVPKELIDKWGVYEHRVSEPDETPSDMSIKAAKNLIRNTGIDPKDIDLIIDCALVPDYILPGNSQRIQDEIGAVNATSLDIIPSSGGVIPQLILAKALIMTQEYTQILITCSCKFTSVADQSDWLSLVLAGDGAASALISRVNKNKGILSSNMITKGEFYSNSGIKAMNHLQNSKGLVYERNSSKMLFYLSGTSYFSANEGTACGKLDTFIIDSVPASAKEALKKVNLSYNDVDFWIMHQNAKALGECWTNKLGIKDKQNYYFSNSKYGNLYNANLLANLSEVVENSLIKCNDIVVLGGLTSGYSTGSVVMRW